MKITIWDLIGYINKWKVLILLVVLIFLLLSVLYVNRSQSYSAETLIRYTDLNAKSGLTPNLKQLNVYEIVSPNIISEVIEVLNIREGVEKIRSNVVITPIIPNEILELKKSKIKEGEEYHYFPTDYSIKYTVGSNKDGEYARNIIDAIVKHYGVYYCETYLYNSMIPEADFGTDMNGYDYLEIAEIIDDICSEAIDFLEIRYAPNSDFRSPTTGMNLYDLAEEYRIIKTFDLPSLFSNILNSQLTKNQEVLLKKYKYRKEQLLLKSQHQTEASQVAFSLMEGFAESSKDVPNAYYKQDSDNDFGTRDIFVNSRLARTKATYDGLVDNYVSDGVGAGDSLIDSDYCESVINAFSSPANTDIDLEDAKTAAEISIEYIKNKMSELYKITFTTITDFNELNASRHIESLSGINIKNNLSLKFYLLVAFAVGLLMGIFSAIFIEITIGLRKKEYL